MFCPLDCWDVCELELKSSKFKATSFSSYLCYKLNNYFKFKRETNSFYKSKNIMLSDALKKLSLILKNTDPKKVLYIKGSGNLGIMQNVTKIFFEKYGAFFAVGSTCDGIGEEGIINSRGKSLILPTWIIKNAKNVLIWGRNIYTTNTHLLPLIKNKNILTIDVIKRKDSNFIQIKPNKDFYLAILLSQYVLEDRVKRDDGVNFDEFKKIVFSYSKKDLLDKCGIKEKEAKKLYEFIKEGAVVLLGLGVAKCKECYKTTWAIDSLFFMLDYFGKEDRGVAFLGSSNFGLNNPFDIEHKNTINLFDIDLDDFEVVFIQGANPLASFNNRNIWEKLKQKTTIVFGKYMDESAKIATLFIPTKDFYQKKDIRGSYFYEYVFVNRKNKEVNNLISEYELTSYLMKKFNFDGLKSEDEYIDIVLSSNLEQVDKNIYKKKIFNKPPYSEGFYTKDKKFHFLNEDFNYKDKEFEIVVAKHLTSLNSQFKRDDNIYINENSKNIMLSFVYENFPKDKIKIDNKLPKNIIYSTGRLINKIIENRGKNAYYEI